MVRKERKEAGDGGGVAYLLPPRMVCVCFDDDEPESLVFHVIHTLAILRAESKLN